MAREGNLPLSRFMADLQGAAYAEELRTSWATALLYRRPGAVLAWLAARAGLPPWALTLAALAVALAMPLAALALPMAWAPWGLFLLGVSFQILDCSDGTLARQTGRASRRGGDMDFLVDMAQWGMLYLALGILADRAAAGGMIDGGMIDGWAWSTVGAMAAWARLFARVVRDTVKRDAPPTPAQTLLPLPPLRPLDWPIAFVTGLSGAIPFLALLPPHLLHWGVVAVLVYALLDIAEGALPLWRR